MKSDSWSCWSRFRIGLNLVFGLTAVVVHAFSGMAEGLELELSEPREELIVLYATGEAEEQASRALVRLRVETKEDKLGAALAKNGEYRTAVVNALVEAGIARSDIKLEKFSSTPSYGKFSGKVKSYTISNTIEVAVSSEEQFVAIAGIVDENESLEYGSRRIDYESISSELDTAAAREALQRLKRKAAVLGEELGKRLELVQFTEVPVEKEVEGHYARARVPAASSGGLLSRASVYGGVAEVDADFGEVKRVVGMEGRFRVVASGGE
ncbi:MAG: SIMPL domain-containing protein [Verrucomicrobiota bacterium]